jgi:hypothetical protein
MHGIHEAEAFLDSALANETFHGLRDIHKAATVGDFKPEVFSKTFHATLMAHRV